MRFVFLCVAFLASLAAHAAGPEYSANSGRDLLNTKIRVDVNYETFGSACRLSALYPHFDLSVETEDGVPSRARFTKLSGAVAHGRPVRAQFHDLSDDEVQSLEIRGDKGATWIQGMKMSVESVLLLARAGEGLSSDACVPPADLVVESSDAVHFDFGNANANIHLATLIDSKPVVLRGTTTAGDFFKLTLSLTQDRSPASTF